MVSKCVRVLLSSAWLAVAALFHTGPQCRHRPSQLALITPPHWSSRLLGGFLTLSPGAPSLWLPQSSAPCQLMLISLDQEVAVFTDCAHDPESPGQVQSPGCWTQAISTQLNSLPPSCPTSVFQTSLHTQLRGFLFFFIIIFVYR